jgi:hypothetical protein
MAEASKTRASWRGNKLRDAAAVFITVDTPSGLSSAKDARSEQSFLLADEIARPAPNWKARERNNDLLWIVLLGKNYPR